MSTTGPQPQIDARPDPMIDAVLAERYRLTRKIGEGAMGSVYEATQVNIGKTVAVKVLREKFVDRPEVAERLVQEARLASSIRHEHIVDITDSGRTKDGRTFVVMEKLDGKALSEIIRAEAPLPEARAISIVSQVANALAAAHARKIVHRDVKPENVFLVERSGQEFAKVLDFGISKSLRPSEDPKSLRLTVTGMVLGTPLYMSPEQARGDEDLDHRIDVYALGVILYECLTGEVPFRGTNYNGIIAQVARAEPTPLRKLRPELRISEAVERVVQKAMAKARGDRYPTMEAFEADLQRVVAGETIEAPAAPEGARKPWLAISVGVGAAVLILVLAGVLMLRRTKNDASVAVSAPPPLAPVAATVPEPKSVVVHVETMPPGAEVRQGDRVFGPAPRDLLLTRSAVPAKLTFHLDGYEVATAQVVPLTDDAIRVKLSKAKKAARPAATVKKPAPIAAPQKKPGGETLPNPY